MEFGGPMGRIWGGMVTVPALTISVLNFGRKICGRHFPFEGGSISHFPMWQGGKGGFSPDLNFLSR